MLARSESEARLVEVGGGSGGQEAPAERGDRPALGVGLGDERPVQGR